MRYEAFDRHPPAASVIEDHLTTVFYYEKAIVHEDGRSSKMWFLKHTPFGEIRIAGTRDLYSYVERTTAFCVVAALFFDVANQLVFFESWTIAIRSWIITVGVVVIVTIPVARAIGKAHLALFRASRTDPLTGLLNRRALFEDVSLSSTAMVLIIADIDRFKSVNDIHGHLAGDIVLCTVANIMQQSLSDIGLVGRLGGEEFALVCAAQDGSCMFQRLDAFRETIARTPFLVNGTQVAVTISAGIANRSAQQTFEQLYAEADKALYVAKTSGRNRIVVAGAADPASAAMAGSPLSLAV